MTLAAVGTTVSVLNGTFTLGKQFYELRAAPGEWRESVKRLATVQHDLAYALKLRDRKFPDKINPGLGDNETFCQVQAAIKALASALLGCEKTLKAVDGPTKKARHRDDDGEEGSSSSSARVVDRFVWVFGGKSEFKDNYAALLLPHVTLSRWITVLENLPDVFEEEEAPPPYDGHGASFDESFLSPKQKQLRRGRSVELRGGEDEQDSRSTRKALSGEYISLLFLLLVSSILSLNVP